MFSSLLIANRGEIACRIIRTAKRLGIRTIAVYSEADREALHVQLADDAMAIGAAPATESYLDIHKIIHAALTMHADAIHPGYGFLSENPAFAKACADHDILFIGPSIDALMLMGSKQQAKQCLEKTNVPLTPGYHGHEQNEDFLYQKACEIGFPVLLKAAAGGGGKGMRRVTEAKEFSLQLASARREAKASFGDDTMLIEKQIFNARHVEVQLMADHHGHVVHLFERDCSIQRRHQKVIEEAPAPHLSSSTKAALAEAAITVARTIQYHGAGTVEFLVAPDESFYFMEMNTRLQVEHPVTEMITHLDLVEWQFRIAAGEVLPLTQTEIKQQGHAIECRIYAEDTTQDGLPSTGTIHIFRTPNGEGIRLDTGFQDQDKITRYYDAMIAKLIAYGDTRAMALSRLKQALNQYVIGGIKTNIHFLKAIVSQQAFEDAALNTAFLTQHPIEQKQPSIQQALMLSAGMIFLRDAPPQTESLALETFSWHLLGTLSWPLYFEIHNKRYAIQLMPINSHQFEYVQDGKKQILDVFYQPHQLTIQTSAERMIAYVEFDGNHFTFHTEVGTISVTSLDNPEDTKHTESAQHSINAPMPSTVVAILKNRGEIVEAGEPLMILEAMKMEHTIRAPISATLVDIFYDIGSQVNEGLPLVELSPLQPTKPEET